MKRYISMDMQALHHYGLSLSDWVLLENIHFLSNNEFNSCYQSKKKLAEHIGISERSVTSKIRNLEEKNLLKKLSNGYLRVTEKWIAIISLNNQNDTNFDDDIESKKEYEKNVQSTQKLRNEYEKIAQSGTQKLRKSSIKKEIKREKERRGRNNEPQTTRKKDTETDLPDWINLETWNEWVEYRKQIKKSLAKSTIEAQIKFLTKYKEQHEEIIEQSIRNGWVGLFAKKGQSINLTDKNVTTTNEWLAQYGEDIGEINQDEEWGFCDAEVQDA